MTNRKGIPAAAFMAAFSSAGRDVAPAESKPDNRPATITVERWDGQKWIEKKLTWDGTQYKETR